VRSYAGPPGAAIAGVSRLPTCDIHDPPQGVGPAGVRRLNPNPKAVKRWQPRSHRRCPPSHSRRIRPRSVPRPPRPRPSSIRRTRRSARSSNACSGGYTREQISIAGLNRRVNGFYRHFDATRVRNFIAILVEGLVRRSIPSPALSPRALWLPIRGYGPDHNHLTSPGRTRPHRRRDRPLCPR
jgi:hypothetical protein